MRQREKTSKMCCDRLVDIDLVLGQLQCGCKSEPWAKTENHAHCRIRMLVSETKIELQTWFEHNQVI